MIKLSKKMRSKTQQIIHVVDCTVAVVVVQHLLHQLSEIGRRIHRSESHAFVAIPLLKAGYVRNRRESSTTSTVEKAFSKSDEK